jgi:drug/metabolite transporter (DMT)-like permease
VDRYDVRTIAAMLLSSVAVGLNLIFLEAASAFEAPLGWLVLIPIFAGLAVIVSGFVENRRRHGRDLVILNRLWAGSVLYLALSALLCLLYQPRLD